MIAAAIPENEVERLNDLYRYEVLDTVYEAEFDEIVQLASKLCNAPISTITLVDFDRQWYKAKHGVDGAETKRDISFCAHAINDDDLFEVKDAATDNRFFDNPLVSGDPKIRYYAGMPLVTNSGYKIGTLCVIDRVPRELDAEQTFALKVLSRQVIKLFELRARSKDLKKIMNVQQQIITVMAHDIRGPLSALKTTYELKNDGTFSEEEVLEIDKIVPVQLNSTINLLNNIVEWGKLQLNHLEPTKDTIHLHGLAAKCIGNFILTANNKGNEIQNLIYEGLVVIANESGLSFVLNNLIGNANKFTSGGIIKVSAITKHREVIIKVSDSGIGMTHDIMESLSHRTWSTNTLGTNHEKGSGLGLKLIYEYLSGIKGNLTFESVQGEGTTVTVTFPLLQS